MAFAALLGILLIVLLAGVPIAYAIGGLAVIGNQWFGATSFTRLAETQFSSINSFVVMAIPFFILAGNVMLRGEDGAQPVRLHERADALDRRAARRSAPPARAPCSAP